MTLRVSVDVEVCIGAGRCVFAAANVFAQSDATGTVVLLDDEPGPEHEVAVRQAALLCPSGAITVDDTAGTR